MNAAQYDLVRHLAKEVRASLSSLLGYAETMYDSSQNTKEKFACLRKIKSIIDHTTKDLKNLEQISLFQKGWLSVRSAQISLEEELSETLLSLQALAQKSGLRFTVVIDGKIPSTIVSDALRLRQLLTHVVPLFLERMERGTLRLTLSFFSESRLLTFRLDSTGENLSKEASEEMVQEAIPGEYLDTEISLVQALISALGGHCTVERSKLGRGYALLMHIDPGPIGAGTKWVENFEWKPSESVAPALSIPDFSGRSFLVVEDDPDIASMLLHFLRQTGAEVFHASDGEEGYRLSCTRPHDIIFLDLQLPKLNGLEVCERLKRRKITAPLIALTANTAVDTKAKVKQAGFTLHLTKPVAIPSLFELMQRVLEMN